MIAFVFEKLRVFVNVARVVVAKRGRERAMEVNILKRGVRMEGLARGSKYYWLTEDQWKLEELARDLAPCL